MTTTTISCMEEWLAEHRGGGNQPQQGTSSGALLPDPKWSDRELSPTLVIAVEPADETCEEHARPREAVAQIRTSRPGDFDFMLGSMTPSNLENENETVPVFSNGNAHNSQNELRKSLSRARERGALVQHHLIESQLPLRNYNKEPTTDPRRPSNSEEPPGSPPPSNSELMPPPRRPPGPGPGPSPRPSFQVLKPAESSSTGHPQSPTSPVRDHRHDSPTRKLFAVRSAQGLQPRSRSRQSQRKESGYDILEKIKVLRAEVWGIRSNIAGKRHVLREKDLAKSVADDKFMQFVRTHSLAKLSRIEKLKEHESLTKLFEGCEMLRNEYGPLEDDCNLLENVLNNREYEMQKLEAALDERWNETPHSQQDTASQHSPPPSNYSGSEFSHDFHPLVVEYLSKIGDVEIFRERLEWHSEEKLTLEAEIERRERVGLKLPEPDQKWLDNYSEAEKALYERLEEAEDERERLRIRCYSLGLVDENGEPLDFEKQERQTFVADELDAGTEKSDFLKFPLLLPYPGNKESLLPDPSPLPDNHEEEDIQEKQNPSDRINDWLLQKLRSSPLDVNLLVRTFESIVGHIIEGDSWQVAVLTFWYNDGSNEMATEFSKSLSEVGTLSRKKTVEQPTSLSGHSGRHQAGILVRSSRLGPPKIGDATVIKVNDYGLLLPPSTEARKGG